MDKKSGQKIQKSIVVVNEEISKMFDEHYSALRSSLAEKAANERKYRLINK